MYLTYKYRLYPTKTQVATLESHLAICRELYNAALQERRDAWKMRRESINFIKQCKQLPEIKFERSDVADVYAQVLVDVLRRVDKTFQYFYRRLRNGVQSGYPRFKSWTQYTAFTYPQHGFAINGKHLRLGKIGSIKIKLHRLLEGEIKTLTIKRHAGKWYACFCVDVPRIILPVSPEHIGIDVGIVNLVTFSDSTSIRNPRFSRVSEARISRLQRRKDRRKRGSKGRYESVRLLHAAKSKIARQRSDFYHKLSKLIIARYGLISIEDLDVKRLMRAKLSKSVNDAAWSSFFLKLAYKAEKAGRILVRVNPRGTSQTCLCGARVQKSLSQRWHNCSECGLSAPRDVVSAQLIDRLGLSLQSETWATAPSVL